LETLASTDVVQTGRVAVGFSVAFADRRNKSRNSKTFLLDMIECIDLGISGCCLRSGELWGGLLARQPSAGG